MHLSNRGFITIQKQGEYGLIGTASARWWEKTAAEKGASCTLTYAIRDVAQLQVGKSSHGVAVLVVG